MVHQLSSTRDPIFNLRVPAHRIIGGYTVKDGVIVPNYTHGDIIEAVFKRTRITVGLMTAAKLISAIEPVLRYQRNRFRGSEQASPGTPRYDLGIQTKQDALHRLADVWAMGEAACSLGFATARLFDQLDPVEVESKKLLESKGIKGTRGILKAMSKVDEQALEYLALSRLPEGKRDTTKYETLGKDLLVRFSLLESAGNVLCPATKLWDTGWGATTMREAVSMMGGYGITEDCPGFLGNKWMDAQLEATYEGPESVQRRQLANTMTHPVFLQQFKYWAEDMRALGAKRPETGALALAAGMDLWSWTYERMQSAKDADGAPLYHSNRQGVTFPMADSICWLLAAHCFLLDVLELEEKGPQNPNLAEGLPGTVAFMLNLCQVQSARAAGESSRICAELVYGYNRPNESPADLDAFLKLHAKVDASLAGSRLAKDRAGESLTQVMIPEALDYPL
jgi:hypothetical protein